MLERLDLADLAVYVVWLPVLEGDGEEQAVEASARLPDGRVRHFWNPDNAFARQAARALHVDHELDLAWDVFLVYGPQVEWSGPSAFPVPTAWMHRLAEQDPRWMTPQRLLEVLRALAPARPGKPTPRPPAAGR